MLAVDQAAAKVASVRADFANLKTNQLLDKLVELGDKSVELKQRDVDRKQAWRLTPLCARIARNSLES